MSQLKAKTERALRAEGGPVQNDVQKGVASFYGILLPYVIFTSPRARLLGSRFASASLITLSQDFNVTARGLLARLALSHRSSKFRGCDA